MTISFPSGDDMDRRAAPVLIWITLVLGACSAPAPVPAPPPAPEGWLVVARTDGALLTGPEARVRVARIGDRLPPGTTVATGAGGGLVVTREAIRISLGPAARVVLADPARAPLDHERGRIRYEVVGKGAAPFRLRTPALDVSARHATFDLAVDEVVSRIDIAAGLLQAGLRGADTREQIAGGDQVVAVAGPSPTLVVQRPAAPGAVGPTVAGLTGVLTEGASGDHGGASAGALAGMPAAIATAPSAARTDPPPGDDAPRDRIITASAPAPPARRGSKIPRALGFERLTAGLLEDLGVEMETALGRSPSPPAF